MAELTDADKLKFINDVSAMLKEPTIKADLVAKNYDPSGRAAVLDDGATNYNTMGGTIKGAEKQVTDLYAQQRNMLDQTYDAASGVAGLFDGLLGHNNALSQRIHSMRPAMHHQHAAAKKTSGSN